MSSLFALLPNSKRLLFLKNFERYPWYRLPLFFCSTILFLAALISVRSFAGGLTIVDNYDVPQLDNASNYLLVRCNTYADNHVKYIGAVWWTFKCTTLFLEPVVNGKPLTKYAHTYYPAKMCPSPLTTSIYQIKMHPTPYYIVKECIP